MKNSILISCTLLSVFAKAQTITTIAGGGSGSDGSVATTAYINDPTWLAFDKFGNYYVVEGLGNDVRKIDASTNIISTFAGTGGTGFNGDGGLADTTNLGGIGSVNFDSNFHYLYIADGGLNRCRKVNMTTNIISTSAGNGLSGFGGDGASATLSQLQPNDICFDKFGNTFVSDVGNQRIRKIDASGIISTYAGNGIPGFSGDNGSATNAQLDNPRSISIDDRGNLYIADMDNVRIRKVSTSGIITTVVGNGEVIYNGDEIAATTASIGPVRVIVHEKRIYIADFNNNRIRMVDTMGIIHTVAGNGIFASTGDGGPSDSAALYGPSGIAFDTCGNLYITEVNGGRIRKVSFNPSCFPEKIPKMTTNELSIHPNPAVNELYVENVRISGQYVLFNITGIIEQTGTLQTGSNRIDISKLPMGLYILMLTTEDWERVVRKVVKE